MLNDAMLRWLKQQQPISDRSFTVDLIAGDASPRKYYRLSVNAPAKKRSMIAVTSPSTEKNAEFLQVQCLLRAAGVTVPEVLASDVAAGHFLLEDLGDDVLLPALGADSAGVWYAKALDQLCRISAIDTDRAGLPAYDALLLQQELDLFPAWFVEVLLGLSSSTTLRQAFSALSAVMIDNARAQPSVVVHRDFHSRNLMILHNKDLAVIDFQDAVVGPVTYDPVSLLKDCYRRWPREQQLAWLAAHQTQLEVAGQIAEIPFATFTRWFDFMGLQRHLKVLGIFARLSIRDDKPQYLQDLPRVLAYILEVLALYGDQWPAIASFAAVFNQEILPKCQEQAWFDPALLQWREA